MFLLDYPLNLLFMFIIKEKKICIQTYSFFSIILDDDDEDDG